MNIPILGYIWLMAFFIYLLWPALELAQHTAIPLPLHAPFRDSALHQMALRRRELFLQMMSNFVGYMSLSGP